jgi:hypothetical protein
MRYLGRQHVELECGAQAAATSLLAAAPLPRDHCALEPLLEAALVYLGKIAVASFFAKNFLPLLTSTRSIVENLDNDVMELDEAAFSS